MPLHDVASARRIPLREGWALELARSEDAVSEDVAQALPIPATVPGTVHTDLLAAGLIPDPYLDDREDAVAWIGRADWRYRLEFVHEPHDGEEAVLCFDGLDTICRIELDGVLVAETSNMHRRYRFPVDLRPGRHALVVTFSSALRHAVTEAERLGDLPRQYRHPYNFIRKSASHFGWDWGPTLVTAGIWRDARIELSSRGRIGDVRVLTALDAGDGIVEVFAAVHEPHPGSELRVRAGDAEVRVPAGQPARLRVAKPQRWWPRGFGEPALHDLAVTLEADGDVIDSWESRIGFRDVRLDTSADEEGSAFRIMVNDTPIPVRGVNWIPDDCFPPRVTSERLRTRLGQALDAGVNLVRVWGGGCYESDEFYRLCDEAGLLVQQDFLFACAAYPESEPLRSEVESEARDNVARLSRHPSLVLWNGNNENFWGEQDWGWRPAIGGRPWGAGYYLDILPRVVAAVDPTRPYWAGSPYSGTPEIHPNDPDHGTMHIWDVWNRLDYPAYRGHRPRFAAEFGWQAPPAWSTLERAVSSRPLGPDSPLLRSHQKAEDGHAKLARAITDHFPAAHDGDDWHFAGQLVQARAIAFGIEHFRALRPRNWGTILWQLNDCWPVISWAVVDGDGRLKPAWYALRAAYATRLVTIQPGGSGPVVHLVNDDPVDWVAALEVRRIGLDGGDRTSERWDVTVPALGALALPLPATLAHPDDPRTEVLVATTAEGRGVWFWAADAELALDPDPLETRTRRDGGDVVLDISARSVARDVCVLADRIDPAAEADAGVVTLLPGEQMQLRVRGIPPGRDTELTRRPVLRHAAELVPEHARELR
ncbi:glycoside hydrolase family 2 protein [Agromyces bauzanensis]|uniref:glycoside hydrolase family 2 protein n=1 Tax=Agromyces bauzanensis TaxID=1308924 RepID=UPI00166879BB|nr:glycoside hydrolase family 2 protein [Agromyces bauzanensis]